MFKRILAAFDGLKTTLPSLRYAINLSEVFSSKIYFLHIITKDALDSTKLALNKPDRFVKEYCIERTKSLFNMVLGEIKDKKIDYEIKTEFAENVETGIKGFINKNKIELCIVQPSPYVHSDNLRDLSKRISKKLAIPVVFIKTDSLLKEGSRILIPIDEKKENLKSFYLGKDFAKALNGKIIFYHTTWRNGDLKTEDPCEHCDSRVKENFKAVEEECSKLNIAYEKIIEMAPTIEEGIIRCAVKTGADIIIMCASDSIIGGKPDLVLNNSMYPLMLIP